MPKIYTPADLLMRMKEMKAAGKTVADVNRLFFDDSGARIAKAVGLSASVVDLETTDRAVDFTISTGALDRYNSTIAPKGWQIDNFNSNPVVLWAHDDTIPAIGRAETTTKGATLKSRAVFATRDVHPLADTIYQLIKGKFIGAASVGWIPQRWEFVDEDGRGFGIDYLEQELLEWSVVNIPANPECLVDARSVGIDTKPLLQWAERALDRGGMLMIPRAELEALRRAAGAPRSTGQRRASEEWKCGAAWDLPIVEDDSWDGPEAEKAIFAACDFDGDQPDTTKARQAFLAYDASAPEKRGSYKLPFVKLIDGKMKASSSGLKAAAQRLSGTDIPQAVKDEAEKVIDAYKSKMGASEESFAANAAALKTLFKNGVISIDEFTTRIVVLARGFAEAKKREGKAISKKNADKLRAAHEHMEAARDRCQMACDHVQSVLDADDDDDDDKDKDKGGEGGDDSDDDDPEQAAAKAFRNRRLRLLKLGVSPVALATAQN